MKKLLVLLVLFLVPFGVFAETKLNSETLAEACQKEGITFNHPDYKEDSKKVNIYLFRGSGCQYCHKLLEFLESITDEYGKYFNVVSYEVWNDTNNNVLMTKVKKVFGDEASGGVPYLVIGDQKFAGYSSLADENIKKAIVDLYNTKPKKRYDVMKHLDDKESSPLAATIIMSAAFILVYILKSEFDTRRILNELDEIKKEIPKETKKEVKKTKKVK